MAEARVERRLAAILAADVAGYSRLMGVNEEGTLATLKAHRRELFDPKMPRRRSRSSGGSKKPKPQRHEFWNYNLHSGTAGTFPAWIARRRLLPL